MPGRFHLYPFQTGDILILKKKHPCGSERWTVRRTGADILLACQKCGHTVTLPRRQLEKAIKSIEPAAPGNQPGQSNAARPAAAASLAKPPAAKTGEGQP